MHETHYDTVQNTVLWNNIAVLQAFDGSLEPNIAELHNRDY